MTAKRIGNIDNTKTSKESLFLTTEAPDIVKIIL